MAPSPITHPKPQPQPTATGTSVAGDNPPALPPSPNLPSGASFSAPGYLEPGSYPLLPLPIQVAQDLEDWLLFSPSSSKGRSSVPASLADASPTSSSYVNIARGKGKAPMEEAGSSSRSGRSLLPRKPGHISLVMPISVAQP
jgi:hypothetical protein